LDHQRFKNPDSFYSIYDEGFFGKIRFPLIKPYEVTKATEESGWVFELITESTDPDSNIAGYHQLRHIEKVALKNGVIMAYTPYIIPYMAGSRDKLLHWFVIIPDKKIETGFETEEDFLAYVKDYGIDKPDWMDTKSAFDQFRKTGCLDWIPDCHQR
jgi:hypothetical protein